MMVSSKHPMHRPLSLPTRAIRAFTALLTVWCLGCSGFEPLLDNLLGTTGGSGMACASGRLMDDAPAMSSSEVAPASALPVAVALSTGARGFDCGCGFCQAPSPGAAVMAALVSPAPGVAAAESVQPRSIVRTPLVPPPERTTA